MRWIAPDCLDVYAAINPHTSFINFQFSTNPTIPEPDQELGDRP